MANEFEELLLKVRADVDKAIADLKRFDRAVDETEANVEASSKKTTAATDKTSASTRKLADESEKTAKSVKSDFEKMTGASDDAAKRFERNFSSSKTATQAFDKTIRELTQRSKTLGDLYNKTGDDKFLRRMQQAEKDAKALTKTAAGLGSTLSGEVTKGAEAAGSSLEGLGPVAAGVAAAFAPLIGGGLAGSILGGVGLAGLGAGIAGQFNSPLVTSAEDQFVAHLQSRFDDATSAFAPVLRDTLGALDNNLGPFWDSLRRGFTELAPYLKLVGDGFARFLDEFGPGIEAAFKGAEPVLTAIADELPSMGQALTVFFQQLEEGGSGAAQSIGYIFQALETAIEATGYLLHGLSWTVDKVTNGFIRILEVLGHLPDALGGDKYREAAANLRSFQSDTATASNNMQNLGGSFDTVNNAIEQQGAALKTLESAWNDATDAFLAYDNAQLRAIEASQAFSKSLKQNGHDWDKTHEKGQANWHALLNNIEAQKQVYENDIKIHGVTLANTTAYQKSIDKLLAQAAAAGLSKDQIDLLRQQFEDLGQVLDKLQNRKVTFTVHGNVTGVLPGNHSAVASVFANSGVNTFANSGVAGAIPHFDLTGTYAGRPGGLYRFAEQSTVEEALIARNGDRGRGLSTLRTAAGWLGASVVTNPLSATYNHATVVNGGGGNTLLYATIVMDNKPIARALVPAVQRANSRSAVSTLG